MTERRYTVEEIDRMRHLIKFSMYPRHIEDGRVIVRVTSEPGEAPDPAVVEDRLRTYMLAGLGPEDLDGKADEASEEEQP